MWHFEKKKKFLSDKCFIVYLVTHSLCRHRLTHTWINTEISSYVYCWISYDSFFELLSKKWVKEQKRRRKLSGLSKVKQTFWQNHVTHNGESMRADEMLFFDEFVGGFFVGIFKNYIEFLRRCFIVVIRSFWLWSSFPRFISTCAVFTITHRFFSTLTICSGALPPQREFPQFLKRKKSPSHTRSE